MKNLRPEITFENNGSIFNLVDNAIKKAYNITEDEYCFIVGSMTEDETDIFTKACGLDSRYINETIPSEEVLSFSMMRKGLEIRNKYLTLYNLNKECK